MISHWTHNEISIDEPPVGAFGFIYLIEGCGRKYIGRKYLTKAASRSIKQKNGIRKQRKTRIESDWRTYMGSCKPLLEDIQKTGKDNYTFRILAWGYTKGQVNALEVFAQIKAGVMVDPSFYNDAVGSGQFRGVKFTTEFKEIIRGLSV